MGYEASRSDIADVPLKTVTNSPILRPQQAPPLVQFALGELADELLAETSAAARSSIKKAPSRDDRTKHKARQARSRAACVCSMRSQPAGAKATEAIMEHHLINPSQPELEVDDTHAADLPELNSLTDGSILELLPGLSQHSVSASNDSAVFGDSTFDHIICDAIALPPSDVAIEDYEQRSALEPGPDTGSAGCGSVSPHTPRDLVSIRYKDRCLDFGALRMLSVTQLRSQIADRFKLASSSFVLRIEEVAEGGGCVVPLACCLAPGSCGATFCLEVPAVDSLTTSDSYSSFAVPGQLPSPVNEPTLLRWVQEPPHTTCQWLTAKTSDFSNCPANTRHCFDPPPAVAFAGVRSDELSSLLAKATVTLWTPLFKDVSQHLHIGPCEATFSKSGGEVSLRWPTMAITELPNNVVGEAIGSIGSSYTVTNSHQGGRGAKGWFHLRVEVPTVGRLWLKNRAGTGPAQIVLKHRRCMQTGRWKERELGPYADHALCKLAGSHIDAKTGRKLCKESCCFGAKTKIKCTTVEAVSAQYDCIE